MPTLHFKGKEYIHSHHLTVPFRGLEVDKAKSLSDAPSLDDNLIIHGDNLHGLKALLPKYAGKVKCIFIDPPYNTGEEGWCYNDNVNSPTMKKWLEKNANPVDKEDMERHDKWLCMMWPRLQLLRELLAEDGFIFVTLDDNENHHFRAIMNEIFGEENLVGVVAWKKTSGDNKPAFAYTHDNLIIYSKNMDKLPRVELNGKQREQYKNPDNDPRGDWAESDYRSKWTKSERKNLYYGIENPSTGEVIYPDTYSDSTRVWGCAIDTHLKNVEQDLVWWGVDGKSKEPKKKRFISEHKGINTRSVWVDAGSNDEASTLLKEIIGDKFFDNPKPIKLLRKVLAYFPNNSIILDSFAGSGTTAHAVLALNAEEKANAIAEGKNPDEVGNRKFILVEMEDYANEVTAERVRRVIKGVPDAKDKALQEGLGGSFTYATLGEEFNIEKMLSGESLPSYDSLAQYVFYTATGESLSAEAKPRADYYIGETDLFEVYLIYKDDLAFLRHNDSALSAEKLEAILSHKSEGKKQRLVFATAKFMGQETLKPHRVTFCQIPYAIHKLAGN